MRQSKTETGLSMLGGALLGAAVMYLLDPETGRERREYLADKAGGALGPAADRARGLGSRLVDTAAHLSSHVADAARGATAGLSDRAADARDSARSGYRGALHGLHGVGERISEHGHDLLDWARGLGGRASDQGRDAARGASAWAGDRADDAHGWLSDQADAVRARTHAARHAAARALDPDHVRGPGHAIGYSAAGLGTLAAGAAAMYFLDPDRGRARRTYACDQATHIIRETGTACRRTGHHLMNRLRGASAQGRSYVSSLAGRPGEVSGEQLVSSVRSRLGHVLSRPTEVQLMADADGAVTLYGRVPASEADRLLSTVNAVPGVSRIINRLEVQDITQGNPATASRPSQTAPQL